MNILGIETSCDETAAAVVVDGFSVRANVVSSQIAQHALFGGVVPELAAREHLKSIQTVTDAALKESGCSLDNIDAVAVTSAPGLIPALLVGVSYAKGIAVARHLPLVGVNHFIAHIYGAFMDHAEVLRNPSFFPILALVVSGGHTALVLIQKDGGTKIIGTTLDDAAGEAFDKAAKILNLGYPGGPLIDRLARQGDAKTVVFPRGLSAHSPGRAPKEENRFNFSFSGLKTALWYHVSGKDFTDSELKDVIASYQAAIVDVLVEKTMDAAAEYNAGIVVACGGVACNSSLRETLEKSFSQSQRQLIIAPPNYCTDNAAMVAGVAYHYLLKNKPVNQDLPVHARLNYDLEYVPFAPGASSEL